MKCLIAEDDFISRRILQLVLSRFGRCDVADNGKTAVNMYNEALKSGRPYNLVCLDIIMPEMDGRQALKEIRDIEKSEGLFDDSRAKILIVSSISDKKNIIESFKEQCDGYLIKPLKKRELFSALHKFGLIVESE